MNDYCEHCGYQFTEETVKWSYKKEKDNYVLCPECEIKTHEEFGGVLIMVIAVLLIIIMWMI